MYFHHFKKVLKNTRILRLFLLSFFVFSLLGYILVQKEIHKNQLGVEAQTTGTVYYVSSTGEDTNDGTSASTAWKTITKVNSVTLGAGDKILFEGGQTFTGSMYLDQTDIGTAANPIELSSYGSGKAIISSDTQNGFFAYNTAGIKINNIHFKGAAGNTNSGILFYTELPGDISLEFVTIDQVEVQNYKTGISIGGWNGKTGYRSVNITNVVAHDLYHEGINLYAQQMYGIQDVYIANNHIYNVLGIGIGLTGGSGNGIVVGKTDSGILEKNIVHDNGTNGDANVGIWAYESNNITIQNNESYKNKTSGTFDGGGFDLDGGVTNSVVQYNYSHDNDGAGYGLYQYNGAPTWSNNTVRYNISQNDGKKNKYGAITLWTGSSPASNAAIYNNTIYTSSSAGNSAIAIAGPTSAITVRNNIFITTGGAPLVNVAAGQSTVLFQNNNYYPSGSSFKIVWKGKTYTSVSNWRSATNQEKNGSTSTGFSTNPKLVNAGGGGTIGDPNQLTTLTQYQLQSSSPMINKGLSLSTFSIDPGTRDYYDTVIPQGAGYDLGAHERAVIMTSTPVPSQTPNPTPTLTPTPTLIPSPSSSPQPSVPAGTMTLLPLADTFVRSDAVSSNFGTSTSIAVAGGGIIRIGYMKFDLSSLAGKQIQTAKLRMYNTNGTDGTQVIKQVTNTSWTETAITYTNRPLLGNTITSFIPGTATGQWVEVDVKNGLIGKEGQTISLGIDSIHSDSYGFNSKEFSTASLRPVLVITY